MSVFIVGAGPGDPELITVRGLDLVRTCDVLVYDRLVSAELIEEARPDAILVPRDAHEQDSINALLVSLARQGYTVVRLKGGDPFVFGRGGEEALTLAEAGIAFEVVPGVSSLAAAPAAAGIPVTHRGVSAQVTVVSGHSCENDDLDYRRLASTPGTLVVFMGLGRLAQIAAGLVAHGRPPTTPAAVIASATTPAQRVVTAPLSEIAAAAQELASPALIVVGDVVRLADRLAAVSASLAEA